MGAVHKLLVEAASGKEVWETKQAMNVQGASRPAKRECFEKTDWKQLDPQGAFRSPVSSEIQKPMSGIDKNKRSAWEPMKERPLKNKVLKGTSVERKSQQPVRRSEELLGKAKLMKPRVCVKGKRIEKGDIIYTTPPSKMQSKNEDDTELTEIVEETIIQEGRVGE